MSSCDTSSSTSSSIDSSSSLPSISLNDYLKRIITSTDIKESTVISSLIYIDRLCSKGKIKLSEYNIHTLTINKGE